MYSIAVLTWTYPDLPGPELHPAPSRTCPDLNPRPGPSKIGLKVPDLLSSFVKCGPAEELKHLRIEELHMVRAFHRLTWDFSCAWHPGYPCRSKSSWVGTRIKISRSGLLWCEACPTMQVLHTTRGHDGSAPPLEFNTGMDEVPEALDMAVRLMTPQEISIVSSAAKYAFHQGRGDRPEVCA